MNLKNREETPSVGGPNKVEMLFSEETKNDFNGSEVLELQNVEVELQEGKYHNGLANVIRFVGRKSSEGELNMNLLLWIMQILLAALFGMAGSMKASSSKEVIKKRGGKRMAWVDSLSEGNVKIIGVLEILAAIGLILPLATGILPWLTPLAAVGLGLTMIGAIILHVQRGDGMSSVMTNVVLLALSGFVAYGRFI